MQCVYIFRSKPHKLYFHRFTSHALYLTHFDKLTLTCTKFANLQTFKFAPIKVHLLSRVKEEKALSIIGRNEF